MLVQRILFRRQFGSFFEGSTRPVVGLSDHRHVLCRYKLTTKHGFLDHGAKRKRHLRCHRRHGEPVRPHDEVSN